MAVAIPARGMLREYGDREDPSTRGKKSRHVRQGFRKKKSLKKLKNKVVLIWKAIGRDRESRWGMLGRGLGSPDPGFGRTGQRRENPGIEGQRL